MMQTPPFSPRSDLKNLRHFESFPVLRQHLSTDSLRHQSASPAILHIPIDPLLKHPPVALLSPEVLGETAQQVTTHKFEHHHLPGFEPPVPNITLQLTSHPIMEPNWQSHQGFYYYPHDNSRAGEPRPHASSLQEPSANDQTGHRRAQPQSTFLPPPPAPPQTSSSSMNLPPFASSFYPSYHSSNAHAASSSAPANIPIGYNGGAAPLATTGTGQSNAGYAYPLTSPMSLPGGAPLGRSHPFESPRMPPGPGPAHWSTSPAMRHLSPTSPTTHLAPPGISSASTSSSSYPSATRTPGNLPMRTKRRSSTDQSNGSWDEDKYGNMGDLGEETEDQPWGMPQEEYKALNPRDKKQVRNRIGARRFRAKRKNYVTNIEATLRHREDELASLRSQVESQRAEINELRGRLGLPLVPPPPVETGLGLVVNHDWDDGKQD